MHLYSVQPLWVLNEVLNAGIYLPKPHLDENTFVGDKDDATGRAAYEWLCTQMELRGIARPLTAAYPVWAWFHCYGRKKPIPDLRTSLFKGWSKTVRSVLLKMEVPDEDVLLSDYHMWHYPLNYWYLGSAREANRFLKKSKESGPGYYRQKPLANCDLDRELKASWQAIFDFSKARKHAEIARDEQPIQATFWAIKREQLLSAVEFGGGFPLKQLGIQG